MNLAKRTVAVALILTFLAFTSRAIAEDTMEHTLQSTLYGGAIGALLGAAVMLISNDSDEDLKWSYIPTGAGIGMLAGAAYGIASSGVVQSISEVEDGRFALKMPTIKRTETFDQKIDKKEVVNSVDLFNYKF